MRVGWGATRRGWLSRGSRRGGSCWSGRWRGSLRLGGAIAGWRWIGLCTAAGAYSVSISIFLPSTLLDGESRKPYLPQNQPPLLRPKHQHPAPIFVTRKRNTLYPLRKRHYSLLVPSLPTVDMYDSLVGLGGEDMRRAHGQAIGRRRALLEARLESGRGLEVVEVDAGIFGYGVGFGL